MVKKIIEDVELRKGKEGYILKEGVLFKGESKGIDVLVLPRKFINEALKEHHDKCGHQGIERTDFIIRMKYTWKGRFNTIKDYVGECAICSAKDSGKIPVVAMGSLKALLPLDLVFLDFVSLDKASDGR